MSSPGSCVIGPVLGQLQWSDAHLNGPQHVLLCDALGYLESGLCSVVDPADALVAARVISSAGAGV